MVSGLVCCSRFWRARAVGQCQTWHSDSTKECIAWPRTVPDMAYGMVRTAQAMEQHGLGQHRRSHSVA
eukprot:1311417-Rhodomonas_salina.1